MSLRRSLPALAMLALAGLPAGATAPTPDAAAPFETLRLSAELARTALRQGDPLLLLAAARLRRSVPLTIADPAADRSATWIDEAERLGQADPRIVGLAADLRVETAKGRAAGPRVAASLLAAGGQRSFVEQFAAGKPAVVYVEGDGDSSLALAVAGARGVACRQAGPGDVKLCAWTPQVAEPMRVQVTNVGAVQSRFILGTN